MLCHSLGDMVIRAAAVLFKEGDARACGTVTPLPSIPRCSVSCAAACSRTCPVVCAG